MVFYGFFKPMVFNGGFKIHGILRRFLNPWYLIGVLKGFPEIYNPG